MPTTVAKIVQIKNPRTGRYIKVDTSRAKIISSKKSDGPYKNVPVVKNQES